MKLKTKQKLSLKTFAFSKHFLKFIIGYKSYNLKFSVLKVIQEKEEGREKREERRKSKEEGRGRRKKIE